MECVTKSNSSTIWAIVSPFMTVALVLLALLVFYLVYRKRLVNEWEMMRINGLKRRSAVCGCQLINQLTLKVLGDSGGLRDYRVFVQMHSRI